MLSRERRVFNYGGLGDRYPHPDKEETLPVFCWFFILILFIACTYFYREHQPWRITQREAEQAVEKHLENQLPAQLAEYQRVVDSINTEVGVAGKAWDQYRAAGAKHRIKPFIAYFQIVGKWDEPRIAPLAAWIDRADSNIVAAGRPIGVMMNFNNAEAKFGPDIQFYSEHLLDYPSKLSMTWGRFFRGLATYAFLFGLFVMPIVLLTQLSIRHRFQTQTMFEAVTYGLPWLAICSLLWPFMATMYSENESPRETVRFWVLRFRYLIRQRKFLLTYWEKTALIEQAEKTLSGDLSEVFDAIRTTALNAPVHARRYALAVFFSSFLPFSWGGIAVSALAQTATVTTSKPAEKPKPKVTLNGFAITTGAQEGNAPPSIEVTMARLKGKVSHGKTVGYLEVDPTACILVKESYVGYDDPTVELRVGRSIGPFVQHYPSPLTAPLAILPFSGMSLPPFTDNGVFGKVKTGITTFRGAMLHGSGENGDGKSRDLSGQIALDMKLPFGTLILKGTHQQGRQTVGYRMLHVVDAEIFLGEHIAFKGIAMDRPDLRKRGFMTQLLVRDGPMRYVGCLETVRTRGKAESRRLDIGVNRQCTDELQALGHVILGTGSKPKVVLQLRHSF